MYRQTNGVMDGQMDGRNFPPVFYRTSSPIGSAAQKDSLLQKREQKNFLFLIALLGSGPDRGRCPVEHRGKIPSVRTSVRMSVHTSVRTSPPGLAQAIWWLAQATSWMHGQMDRRTGGWMDGWVDRWNFLPVFYRTSSPIGSAALPTSSFSTTA